MICSTAILDPIFATEIRIYAKEQSQPSARAFTVIMYLILQPLLNKSTPSRSFCVEVLIAISPSGILPSLIRKSLILPTVIFFSSSFSSLDAFRKEKTLQNKYKVYQENGALIGHFEDAELPDTLEKDDSGVVKSLANVIRLNNPLIVIDEGHKTKTKLSIDFLKDLNPSFVIEYTATPRPESNILVEVHSSELKEQQMVKLPLVLESHSQWQNAILQGVLRRRELENIAKKEKGERIRPIALFQAEQEKEDEKKITVGKIRDFLIREGKISEDNIS